MEELWKIAVPMVLAEALTEYVKTAVLVRDRQTLIVQLCALAIGLLVCISANVDLPAMLGMSFRVPLLGCVITGVLASRGANYVSDLLKRLQYKKGDKTNE